MIYFIRSMKTGQIKIGTTIGLVKRLSQLGREHGRELEVLAVLPGDQSKEVELHQRFGHLRMEGEWFDAGPDLLEFIRDHGRPWNGTVDEPMAQAVPKASPGNLAEERYRSKASVWYFAIRLCCLQRMLDCLADVPVGNWDEILRSELRKASEELAILCKVFPEAEKEVLRIHDAS